MDEGNGHSDASDDAPRSDTFQEGVMFEGMRPPLSHEQRLRRLAFASVAVACVLVVVFWPTLSSLHITVPMLSPGVGVTATPRTIGRITVSNGWSQSSSQCPVTPQTASSPGLEIHPDTFGSGDVWALMLTNPPLSAHSSVMIMWRATGSGAFRVVASGPGSANLMPANGPDLQPGGDKWQRPGDEWITNFLFPQAGC